MTCLRFTKKLFLLILPCLFNINVISTQEGSSYFFYHQPEYPRDCQEAREQCSSNDNSGVYIIKPDGYPEPFEVYCNNEVVSGGWTVIQHRVDGSVVFKRNWEEYKNGFGFSSAEFWIGNEKFSYLTNQAIYELRIDMMLSNGSSFYVKYKSFRISDEFSHYSLISTDDFSGNSSCVVSTCSSEMMHGGCSCHQSCDDPIAMTNCEDDCVETCIGLPSGCFVSEKNAFISNGEWYVNSACSENCTCINNQLSCNSDYECSADATCTEKNSVRKCYCNEGYDGDGETCTALFTDCYDAYQAGHTRDDVYTILPTGWSGLPFNVSCDMTTDGGGWTIFQRRTDGKTDFYRYWDDFKHGFGSVEQGKDFWLGNEQIHYLTNQKTYKLRVDIRTPSNSPTYAEYASFSIDNESFKYQVSFGNSSGSAAFGLNICNNGGKFSTRDQDNDGCSVHNFAEGHKGAWWYNMAACSQLCVECYNYYSYCYYFETRSGCNNVRTASNLNGDYDGGNGQNIFWYDSDSNDYNFCNRNFSEMKIRPSSL